jgi:protein phosphatase
MRFSAAGASHVGLRRTVNQDAYLLLPEEGLFCVADGMGGHASGEVAARLAVEEMAEFFRLTGRGDEAAWPYAREPGVGLHESRLLAGIRVSNRTVCERGGADDRLRGMGTTLVAAYFPEGEGAVVVGHVGDSRAYLWRRGALAPLTRDHSLLNDLLRTRRLTAEEIEGFPHKNVIVRALGLREAVEADVSRHLLADGDVLLLCCDGLSGMVADPGIAEVLRGCPGDLRRAAQGLVEAANAAGGADNVTCVLVQPLPDADGSR